MFSYTLEMLQERLTVKKRMLELGMEGVYDLIEKDIAELEKAIRVLKEYEMVVNFGKEE